MGTSLRSGAAEVCILGSCLIMRASIAIYSRAQKSRGRQILAVCLGCVSKGGSLAVGWGQFSRDCVLWMVGECFVCWRVCMWGSVESIGNYVPALGGLVHVDDHGVREMCLSFLLRPNGVQVHVCFNIARIV